MRRIGVMAFVAALLLVLIGLSTHGTAEAQGGNNVAEGRATSQSSTAFGGFPGRAVDGDIDGVFSAGSVSHTTNGNESWWEVDLGSIKSLDFINLWNRTDCCAGRLSDFHVFVSNRPFNSTTVSGTQNQSGVMDIAFTGTVNQFRSFDINRSGRYVRVQLDGFGILALAEVEIIKAGTAFDNVAEDKTASASSTGFNGAASRAVDGDFSGVWSDRSIAHTVRESQPWIEVDLEDLYELDSINIWNRTDCCSSRLSDFYVFMSDFPFTSDTVNGTRNQAGVTEIFHSGQADRVEPFKVDRTARYVRVQLVGSNDWLALAEIEVYGELAPADNASPTSSIFNIANGATSINGNASDNRGVSSVSMRIRNTATGKYLQPNGSFSNAATWLLSSLTAPDGPTTGWNYNISSLPTGNYTVTGGAIDTSNNVGSSFQASISNGSSAPTVPGRPFKSESTSSTLTVSWSPSSAGNGVERYRVFRDGTYIGSVNHPSTSFRDRYLDTDKSFKYEITAVDTTGEESAKSASRFISTDSVQAFALSKFADDTWSVNGTLHAIVTVGDIIYIGGDFQSLTTSGSTVTRNNVAAIDRNTGGPVASFNPNLNGQVRAIELSPDGEILYLGGTFSIGGNDKLAAFDPTTGAHITSIDLPSPNSSVRTIVSTGDTLYFGGTFSKVDNINRSRLAAINLSTNALNGWAPVADDQVTDIIVDPTRVWVAGSFKLINGLPARGFAPVHRTTGELDPTSSNATFPVLDITALGDQLFVAAAGPGGRLAAYSRTTGALQWIKSTDGNVQAVDVVGDFVYFGGHYANLGGDAVGRLTRHNITNGALDQGWLPFLNGVRSVNTLAIDDERLYVGGDFTFVSEKSQQAFAQFSTGGPN